MCWYSYCDLFVSINKSLDSILIFIRGTVSWSCCMGVITNTPSGLHKTFKPSVNSTWLHSIFSKCFFYYITSLVTIIFKYCSTKLLNGTIFTLFNHFIGNSGNVWFRQIPHLITSLIHTLWHHNSLLWCYDILKELLLPFVGHIWDNWISKSHSLLVY